MRNIGLNSAFLGLFLYQLRLQLLRPWIPNSMRCQHFRSSLGAFCLWEFRVFSTNLNILRSICSGHGDPARRRQRWRPPTVHRGSTHAPRLQRPVASEDEASACSELRSAVTRKRPSLNRADGPARTNPNFDHPSGGRLCPVPIAKAGKEGCRPLGKNEATFHCCVLC